MSKNRSTDEGFKEALRESDVLGDVMSQEGLTMPKMEEMQRGLERITGGRTDWADDNNDKQLEDEDLEELMGEKTPVLPSSEVFKTPETGDKGKKPVVELTSAEEEHEQDYAESFASQRETSQLREELEQMSDEVKELKATISGLLKEREALPGHLSTIREDINQQMTLMLAKLHSALESDVASTNVKAASTTLEEMRERATDRLAAAADYAQDRPRESSPLATKGAELKGKRRFRPVR